MDISVLLNVLFAVFALIGIAIGFHRGLFDQLLSWAIILVSFLTPYWLTNALFYSGNALSATGQSLSNMGASFGISITNTPVEHFINAKFLQNSIYATAQDFVNGTIGYIVLLAILVVVFIVISIVGMHFANHYIEKYRNLRKNFKRVDIITGGVFGIVNAYVVWLIISSAINLVYPIITDVVGA